jgi:HAD superfamily hydrolase (TIGR01450 family)
LSLMGYTQQASMAELIERARATLFSAKGILLDWDGCIALGDEPHPAGLAFLRRYADRIAIVSNNSTLWPEDIARLLNLLGVPIGPERILLAGHQALVRAKHLKLKTTILGGLHMKALARCLGIEQVSREPDLIVLLRDTRFSYARLSLAANALSTGARLIVSNPDLNHPGANGRIVPETGALLAALRASVKDSDCLRIEVIGKPQPFLFQMASQVLGIDPVQAVMVGDNPATDIIGASRLSMPTILVTPGSKLSLVDLL